ncbi:MAG: ABC transporter ATP-binding protein [Patescibacteria group bacterium]
MIEIKDIKKIYSSEGAVDTVALAGISFDVKEGDFVAIVGKSGSGKSTLMHIMGLLEKPTSGTYFLKGKNVNDFLDEELAELRNKEIGFVFQMFNLLKKTSVKDNVGLPLTYSKIKDSEKEIMIDEAIRAVGLTERAHHLPNQLSGGEQQRVAIARAIVNNPSLIFADEPTGNLDSKSGQQIMEILEDLNELGRTIILVTHEQYTAQMAKRIITLGDGQLISDEKVNDRKTAKNALMK